METFGCLGAETALKDEWKCAAEVSGALSVEICGMIWMLRLCATSWDFQIQVCCACETYIGLHQHGQASCMDLITSSYSLLERTEYDDVCWQCITYISVGSGLLSLSA